VSEGGFHAGFPDSLADASGYFSGFETTSNERQRLSREPEFSQDAARESLPWRAAMHLPTPKQEFLMIAPRQVAILIVMFVTAAVLLAPRAVSAAEVTKTVSKPSRRQRRKRKTRRTASD
jgi:hypothetical protein